jgi:myo-inositol-1(or 4)-monophosphatase
MGSVVTDELLELAVELADEAGAVLQRFAHRRQAGEDIGEERKSTPTDMVSEADRAAERLIAERLLAARPDDGLLGEEGLSPRKGTSGLRWVVDPLDGTSNFLYGQPTWSVSIACEDGDGTIVGVVRQPDLDETFQAVRGGGARLGERRLEVTGVGELARTLVATGFAYDPPGRADHARDLADLLGVIRDVRRGGSAALDLAWCAAGRVDAYVEFGLSPWDWAAGRLLVQEAGGTVHEHRRVLGGRERVGVIAGGEAAVDHLVAWYEARPEGQP